MTSLSHFGFSFVRVFGAIVFSAMALGNASAFAPDAGKAQTSAQRIIKLLDSEPSIDSQSKEGKTLPVGLRLNSQIVGFVCFCCKKKNVLFCCLEGY
jgi:hypothetical protein